MKKILIGVIILLLLILGFVMCFKGIQIGNIKIESINQLKSMNNSLDIKLSEANKLSSQTYSSEVDGLDSATKKLNTTKTEYNSKVEYALEKDTKTPYLRKYNIETLMVDLGRYSKQNGLKDLKLDLKTTDNSDIYDINLTIIGPYESIYGFISSIQNDDELLFNVVNLKLTPYVIKTTTTIINEDLKTSDVTTDNPFNFKETITSSDATSTNTTKTNTNNTNNTTNTTNTNTTNAENANNTTNTNNNANTANDNTKSNTNTTKTDIIYDPKNVQAEFTIENISVAFE